MFAIPSSQEAAFGQSRTLRDWLRNSISFLQPGWIPMRSGFYNFIGLANNYFQNPKSPETINQYDVRIDETLGVHDTVFGVFDRSNLTRSVPNQLPGSPL